MAGRRVQGGQVTARGAKLQWTQKCAMIPGSRGWEMEEKRRPAKTGHWSGASGCCGKLAYEKGVRAEVITSVIVRGYDIGAIHVCTSSDASITADGVGAVAVEGYFRAQGEHSRILLWFAVHVEREAVNDGLMSVVLSDHTVLFESSTSVPLSQAEAYDGIRGNLGVVQCIAPPEGKTVTFIDARMAQIRMVTRMASIDIVRDMLRHMSRMFHFCDDSTLR